MRKLILIAAACFLSWYMMSLLIVTPAYAEKIPALSEIPADLPDSSRVQLTQRKQALERDLADFQASAAKFNARDAKDQSDSEYEALDAWRTRCINAAKAFNKDVVDAAEAASTLPKSAAELVEMFNRVSAAMPTNNGDKSLEKGVDTKNMERLNCNFYFRGMGRELLAKGYPATGPEWTNTDLQANKIVDIIVTNKKHWRKIRESDVQNLANQGIIVVGVTKHEPNGHIAIVFPIPPGIKVADGTGPFVRDGNETMGFSTETGNKKIYPHEWGAVRASKAWPKSGPQPMWYIWLPSKL